MPISAAIASEGLPLVSFEILPGTPISITHYDANDPQILVISCNLDESGGVITRANSDTAHLSADSRIRSVDPLTELVAFIGFNELHERQVRMQHGIVNLILKHYRPE
ncbi:hypothetical protein BH10PAT3_BH10PAT3_4970 [soil metagenome]